MNRTLHWYSATMLVALAGATPAIASDNATGSFTISVRVPEFCDLQANGFVKDRENTTIVGDVLESCNHNRGFQILASHRPLEAGEQVRVTYGEDHALLEQSGLSSIAFRAGARHGRVPVAISSEGLTEAPQVSFSLTAV